MTMKTKMKLSIDKSIMYRKSVVILGTIDDRPLAASLKALNPIPSYYLIFYRLLLCDTTNSYDQIYDLIYHV